MRIPALVTAALALALAWAAAACTPATTNGPALDLHAPIEASLADAPSLFAEPWTWTDEGGQPVTFARWRGRPLVVTAMFTQCKATCPRTLAKLRRVYDDFQRAGRDAQFVVVTLDPANDTPPTLTKFKTDAGLPASWHFLSGDLNQTRDLRELLGIHVVNDGPHLLHDGRIVIFDDEGRPARALEGYGLDHEVKL